MTGEDKAFRRTFEHDAEGNIIGQTYTDSQGTRSFKYNAEGEITDQSFRPAPEGQPYDPETERHRQERRGFFRGYRDTRRAANFFENHTDIYMQGADDPARKEFLRKYVDELFLARSIILDAVNPDLEMDSGWLSGAVMYERFHPTQIAEARRRAGNEHLLKHEINQARLKHVKE